MSNTMTAQGLVSAYGMSCGHAQRYAMPGMKRGRVYAYPGSSFYLCEWTTANGIPVGQTFQKLANARRFMKEHGGTPIDSDNSTLWAELS